MDVSSKPGNIVDGQTGNKIYDCNRLREFSISKQRKRQLTFVLNRRIVLFIETPTK